MRDRLEAGPRSREETMGPDLGTMSSSLLRKTHSDILFKTLSAFAVVVALFVRWHGLASQSLWGDEGFTLWVSQLPPNQIWQVAQSDTSPPLYYLLLHFWIHWFGISETSLRGLSAFLESLCVPIFCLLAKKILADKRAVTIAMSLFALCAFQVEYAQEARFYGLLLFLALASVYSAIAFLEMGSISSFGCVTLSLTAGLYAHNMMLFYLPGIALLWFIYPSDQRIRQRSIWGLLCVAIVLLSYSPWIPSLRRQTQMVEKSFWVSRPTAENVVESMFVLSGFKQDPWSIPIQPGAVAGQFTWRTDGFLSMWSSSSRKARLLRFSVSAIMVLCLLGSLLNVRHANRKKVAALFSYSFAPMALAFFVSRISQPVYLNRAFIATSGIIPILFAAPHAFQTTRLKRLFLVINLIALFAVTATLFEFLRSAQKADWRGATNYLVHQPRERRKLLFAEGIGQILFEYYNLRATNPSSNTDKAGLPTTWGWKGHPDAPFATLSNDQLIAPLREAGGSTDYDEIDVVLYRPADRLNRLILGYLNAHCTSLHEADFAGGIRIIGCKLQANLTSRPNPKTR